MWVLGQDDLQEVRWRLGHLCPDCHSWWSPFVWEAPWRLTKRALFKTATGRIAGAPVWNQNFCAQGLGFHWQKQELLDCSFIVLSLIFVPRALPQAQTLSQVSIQTIQLMSALLHSLWHFLSIQWNPFISPSACSSFPKLSFRLKAQLRDPGYNLFNCHVLFKTKLGKTKLYSSFFSFFFLLLAYCRRVEKPIWVNILKIWPCHTTLRIYIFSMVHITLWYLNAFHWINYIVYESV